MTQTQATKASENGPDSKGTLAGTEACRPAAGSLGPSGDRGVQFTRWPGHRQCRRCVRNVDPDDGGLQFAWSESGGWINAEPGENGGPGLHVPSIGALWGFLWSENFGWINANCSNLDTCAQADFAVRAAYEASNPDSIVLHG